jgi:hypothetical protein
MAGSITVVAPVLCVATYLHLTDLFTTPHQGIELEESRYTLSAMLRSELLSHMEDLGAGAPFVEWLSRRVEMVQGDIRHYEDKVRGWVVW